MAKKERASKKEKPLEKMTSKELREIGLTIEELTGVHGMNKPELISAIKKARGIEDKEAGDHTDIREIKKQIVTLKEKKIQAQQEENKDKKQIEILRKKINRLKKKTRRAA